MLLSLCNSPKLHFYLQTLIAGNSCLQEVSCKMSVYVSQTKPDKKQFVLKQCPKQLLFIKYILFLVKSLQHFLTGFCWNISNGKTELYPSAF